MRVKFRPEISQPENSGWETCWMPNRGSDQPNSGVSLDAGSSPRA